MTKFDQWSRGWRRYVLLASIATLSLLMVFVLTTKELRTLAAIPGIAALLAAVWTFIQDERKHGQQLERQANDHGFAVASASHMAEVVFDRFVIFAEAYDRALTELLSHMFQQGPSIKTEEKLHALRAVRAEHHLWISTTVSARLDTFEGKVRDMILATHMYDSMQQSRRVMAIGAVGDEAWGDRLMGHFDKAHDLWQEILHMGKPRLREGEAADAEVTAQNQAEGYMLVVAAFRESIGVEQLTQLRDSVLKRALSNLPQP
jgi:hypothetical protein